MDYERTAAYIDSLDTGNSLFLNRIEEEAKKDGVPIIRRPMQSLLRTLLAVKSPGRILEIGTATGFSSLLMAENTPDTTEIITIEKYEKRIPIARANFESSLYGGRIKLMALDASEALEQLRAEDQSFDLIFMDAAKGQYPEFLKPVMELLKTGGVIISDNVLREGDIIESKFAMTRRDRTIHKRMREYLYTLTHDERLRTTILPIGDGAAVSVKIV